MANYKINREEFYSFLTLNQEKFYRLAQSYVKNSDAALDVVQESVAAALTSLHKLQQPAYMKTWFYRIIINTSITYLRKNQKYVYDEGIVLAVSAKEAAVSADTRLDLYSAIMELDDKYRTTILLRYFEDMKVSEVALILDIPENTAKTRIRTALLKLSKFMEVDVNYG